MVTLRDDDLKENDGKLETLRLLIRSALVANGFLADIKEAKPARAPIRTRLPVQDGSSPDDSLFEDHFLFTEKQGLVKAKHDEDLLEAIEEQREHLHDLAEFFNQTNHNRREVKFMERLKKLMESITPNNGKDRVLPTKAGNDRTNRRSPTNRKPPTPTKGNERPRPINDRLRRTNDSPPAKQDNGNKPNPKAGGKFGAFSRVIGGAAAAIGLGHVMGGDINPSDDIATSGDLPTSNRRPKPDTTVPQAKTKVEVKAAPTKPSLFSMSKPAWVDDLGKFKAAPDWIKGLGDKLPSVANAKNLGRGLGIAGVAATVIPDVISIGTTANDPTLTNSEKRVKIAETAGSTTGALGGGLAGFKAGAAAGGLAGSAFAGVGAIPGALIGGIIGSIGGSLLGSEIGKSLFGGVAEAITSPNGKQQQGKENAAPATSIANLAEVDTTGLTGEQVEAVTAKINSMANSKPIPTTPALVPSGLGTLSVAPDPERVGKLVSGLSPNQVQPQTVDRLETITINTPEGKVDKEIVVTYQIPTPAQPTTAPVKTEDAVKPTDSEPLDPIHLTVSIEKESKGFFNWLKSFFTGDDSAKEVVAANTVTTIETEEPVTPPMQTSHVLNTHNITNSPRGLTEHDYKSAQFTSYLKALAYRESTGNYAANTGSYHGAYQMGDMAFETLGYKSRDGKWTGKDGIKSLNDFIANKKVQDSAAIELTKLNWRYLNNSPVGEEDGKPVYAKDFVGRNIAGVNMTESGLLAASHLGGYRSVKKMLASDGKEMPVDGNGVPIINYMQVLGGKSVHAITGNHDLRADLGNFEPYEDQRYVRAGSFREIKYETNQPRHLIPAIDYPTSHLASIDEVKNKAQAQAKVKDGVPVSAINTGGVTDSQGQGQDQSLSLSDAAAIQVLIKEVASYQPNSTNSNARFNSQYQSNSNSVFNGDQNSSESNNYAYSTYSQYSKPQEEVIVRQEAVAPSSSVDLAKLEAVFKETIVRESQPESKARGRRDRDTVITLADTPVAINDFGIMMINSGVL